MENLAIVSSANPDISLGAAKFKINPVHDWRSTLHNWRFCQVQSDVTQN